MTTFDRSASPGAPIHRAFITGLRGLGLGVALSSAAITRPLLAQQRDSVPCPADTGVAARRIMAEAHVVRWYEVGAVLGATVLLSTLDEPTQRYMQRHRSEESNEIAEVFRQEGEVPYYAGVSLGVLAVGAVSGNTGIRRAGTRLVASVALTGLEMSVIKRVVGRSRPNEDVGAFAFHPFTSLKDSAGVETRGAMPSGHTAAAFAVATSLADDIHNPIADVLLYTAAMGTAFSRLNDNRHWLSDTFFGATLGVFTAKVVNGRWRVFGIRPPEFLVTPAGTPCLQWTGTF